MASYLPPTDTLPTFNPSVFQSNLTADELDTKVKALETKTQFQSIDGITTVISGLKVPDNLEVGSNADVEQSIDDLEDKTALITKSGLTTTFTGGVDVTGNTAITGTLGVTLETTLSRTATAKKVISKNVAVDSNIDNLLTTVFTGLPYQSFDNNFSMERDTVPYKEYTIGLLGDNTTNANVFAIGGYTGGIADPKVVFGIDTAGDAEIAGDVTLDKDLKVVGDTVKIGANEHYPMLQSASALQFTASGTNTDGTHTGTQSFPVTFTTAPIVVAQMISGSAGDAFIINVYNVSTTGFEYKKFYGVTSTNTINTAATENFYYIAMGRVAN